MKVKIKKEGKKETYNTINSWAEVSLEKWIKIIDLETGSKTKEAEETIAIFSDMPRRLVNELSIRDVAIIISKMSELQSKQDTKLKKVYEIEGVEYGMHPNLDDITLGEYADLESFIKDGINKNLPEIMAILFRPIVKMSEKNKDIYTVEAYDGDITFRAEQMKKMTAEQVQNALVFFWNFVSVFLQTSKSFLTEQEAEMKMELRIKTLEIDGDGSEFSTGSATKI
jgi:hypothetical protein